MSNLSKKNLDIFSNKILEKIEVRKLLDTR
jgi:hypothetical protein